MELPEGFACPTPPSVRPIFAGRGQVISGRLRTDLKVWNEHKIIAWSLGPMKTANNYLNTVSVDVVSLFGDIHKVYDAAEKSIM